MKAPNKIRREILQQFLRSPQASALSLPVAEKLSDDASVEKAYAVLVKIGAHRDYENEMRGGHVETGLPSPFSRNYEGKEVASPLSDGTWVGWTYWHGGGKHGDPENLPWIEDAYDLAVTEEQQTVTVRKFHKV